MGIWELLEVVIGLVLAWLALALAVMGVQEWIAGLAKSRAKDLEKAIRGMLDPEEPPSGNVFARLVEWVQRLFANPGADQQSDSLVHQLYDNQLIKALAKPGKKPSYIPDRTFAMALFDTVMKAGTQESVIMGELEAWKEKLQDPNLSQEARAAVEAVWPELEKFAKEAIAQTGVLSGWPAKVNEIKDGIKDSLGDKYDDTVDNILSDLGQVEMLRWIAGAGIGIVVKDKKVQDALTTLITDAQLYAGAAEDVMAAARTNVENWFNDTMDRAGGWYKRRTQLVGAILGIGFAFALNVDTLTIADVLWREPAVRQAFVAQAAQVTPPDETKAMDPKEAYEQLDQSLEDMNLPIGWTATEMRDSRCLWRDKEDSSVRWGIPLGQKCVVPMETPEGIPGGWRFLLAKIVGLIISGLAGSLGAPFWFDVLKTITNVRATGLKPSVAAPKQNQK